MFLSTLFSLPAEVYLSDVCLEQETLTLVLKSSQTSAACPACTHPSTRIRGRYTRTLADLPCQGRAVRVRLEVRRFVCRTRSCPRTTFAEGFPRLTREYARRTLRQADTVVRWLRAHRGVKIISRDRAGAYAEAATRGAPRARQVADRYHMLVNLRDALKGTLARHQGALPLLEGAREAPLLSSQRPTELPEVSAVPVDPPRQHERAEHLQDPGAGSTEPRTLTAAQRRRQISRTNRLARYEQIVTLHREGRSQRAIARQLHVSRKVVHRSVRAGTFVERAPTGRRQSKRAPYLPYLRQRWEQGCHNGLQLAREIQAQGFRGSASLVGKLTGDWRARLPGPPERVRGKKRQAVPRAKRQVSARQASWVFVKPKEQLTADQQVLMERICQSHVDLQELYQLGQDFGLMVKQRQPKRLDPWLARAQKSASIELRGFASGIKRDYAAVKAALSLPWSQGQVEGQITRLKLLKRQMYGRARFELLRSRVLRRA